LILSIANDFKIDSDYLLEKIESKSVGKGSIRRIESGLAA
jgi:hypothetical protein